jgi:protein-tyrosine-phosphatase
MKKAKSKIESQQTEINKYIPSIPLKKIPPEKVLQILRKAGYDVNEEQSEEIMEFLYIIVKLTLKEFFTSD